MNSHTELISTALFVAVLCLCGCKSKETESVPEYDFNPDTDWFHDAKAGEKCAKRDLPMEMKVGVAVKAAGIK